MILAQVCVSAVLLLAFKGMDFPQKRDAHVAFWRWLEIGAYLALQNTLEIVSIDGLGSENASLVPVLMQVATSLKHVIIRADLASCDNQLIPSS